MISIAKNEDLLSDIFPLITNSDKVTILTAFLSNNAVTKVFAKTHCKIEVYTSFFREFVDPAGLESLLALNAKVYIYTGKRFFHPKMILFHRLPTPTAIIGSSNFTMGGLNNNYELNLIVDDKDFVDSLLHFVDSLRTDPLFGLLTKEALEKYKAIESTKSSVLSKTPLYLPDLNDYSELNKQLIFQPTVLPNAVPRSNNVLKLRLTSSGKHSREAYDVIWINKKKDILYGSSSNFFPPDKQTFALQCFFGGHEFAPIETYVASRQISGLRGKLRKIGLRLMDGDILAFEQLELKSLYKLTVERDRTL